jgi:outer membrane protein assembly factor BamD (BamD/ComL family)
MRTPPIHIVLIAFLLQFSLSAAGQLGFDIKIPKSKEYEDRQLRSEKTKEGKLGYPGRLLQNTVTHYNYTFNAARKLNEVLQRAKSDFKDDYSKLLPFYNYTLEATAKDSLNLDTIIQKASSGIALHDLRNDWVDNLYLLWGAAYHFQKKFDSAYQLFQFINYAFAPKEKDGYYKTIGSARDGNQSNSVATPEKKGLLTQLTAEPPSRNDAFIWQIRNYLAQDQFSEAATLTEMLRKDPKFPKRLLADLEEVTALRFYKQEKWDSAAYHLAVALESAPTQQEKARWEYLTGQLYEQSGQFSEAKKFYNKTIPHTTDLILEIYARLGAIRANKTAGMADIERNVQELYKMAEKEKYTEYRDIIFYMAAQMDLTGNNQERAYGSLLKSTKASSNSIAQRNKAFLQLAEMSYAKGDYTTAYNFYDSVKLDDKTLPDPKSIQDRKKALSLLASNIEVLQRQDSLRRIAALPEEERKEFVRKVLRQLRKEEVAKMTPGVGNNPLSVNPSPQQSLFTTGGDKGEWYFYNTASRNRGLGEFKAKWGNRPNNDNWRRSSSQQSSLGLNSTNPADPSNKNSNSGAGQETDFESLYNKLPLTEAQLQLTNDSISNALLQAGKILIQEIEDCQAGTPLLERLTNQYPQFDKLQEALFNLYLCYQKNGPAQKAAAIKSQLTAAYPNDPFTKIIVGTQESEQGPSTKKADSLYTSIYNHYLKGDFAAALAGKKIADSLFANSAWSSQLLYIEAVYYIKERRDSTAIRLLREIGTRNPSSPLAERANKLIEELKNRELLENELQQYKPIPNKNRP